MVSHSLTLEYVHSSRVGVVGPSSDLALQGVFCLQAQAEHTVTTYHTGPRLLVLTAKETWASSKGTAVFL